MDEIRANTAAHTLDCSDLHTKEDLMRFIKHRRAFLGLTQAQIAAAVGLSSPDYIGLIEHEKRLLEADRWPMLADILQVNRQALSKLYMKVMMPNTFATFWGSDSIDLGASQEERKFTHLSPQAAMFLQRMYSLSPAKRKTVEDMVEALSS